MSREVSAAFWLADGGASLRRGAWIITAQRTPTEQNHLESQIRCVCSKTCSVVARHLGRENLWYEYVPSGMTKSRIFRKYSRSYTVRTTAPQIRVSGFCVSLNDIAFPFVFCLYVCLFVTTQYELQ